MSRFVTQLAWRYATLLIAGAMLAIPGIVHSQGTDTGSLEGDWRALIALYDATDGDNWTNNDNWSASTEEVPTAQQLGMWHGVVVENGRVTRLVLFQNNLRGTIPDELGNLSSLELLRLVLNEGLTGSVPASLGNLSSLRYLDLAINGLTGSIPAALGNLSNLERLELRTNKLTGSVPAALGNLTNLEVLHLSSNSLEGTIPGALANLPNLHELWLSDNRLTGTIPAELVQLSKLERLRLSKNSLSGEIPAELGNMQNLKYLGLGSNNLHGSIPTELGNLTHLREISLNRNRLSGPIPASLASLEDLRLIWLHDNQLTGSLPAELADRTELKTIYVHQNLLTGPIPSWIGNIKSLKFLSLHDNAFTGSVPDEFGKLAELTWLDIYNNDLSGELPESLTNIPGLTRFWWGGQALCAPVDSSIPTWLANIQDHNGPYCEPAIIAVPASLSIPEGDPAGSELRVQLATRPSSDVTVAISGHADSDVRLSRESLTFSQATWSSKQTVRVTAVQDADAVDDEESLVLTASGGNYSGISNSVAVTVVDDGFAASLQIAGTQVSESAGRAVFKVTLSAQRSSEVTVDYATLDGTATAGEDYLPISGVLRIRPGGLSKEIEVTVLEDALSESSETFMVILSNAVGAALIGDAAVGVILDNDTYQLGINDVTVSEADGEAVFTVLLDRPNPVQAVSVQYATADGTAQSGEDYEPTNGVLTFSQGETVRTIRVPILEDDLPEPRESFTLLLSGAQYAEVADGEGTATILDDDVVPELSIDDVAVSEDAGSAVFSVRLSSPTALAVTVSFSMEDETAEAGEDYTALSGTLRFGPGEVVQELAVPILSDELDEEDETFLVRLSGATNAGIARGAGRGTITDDDESPMVSVHDGRAIEDAGMLRLPVRLSRASSRPVIVQFATSDVTAEAGQDYTSSRGFVIFEGGSTEGVVAISLQDDVLDEDEEETFRVTLSRTVNATVARSAATGTIVDNDGAPLLRVGDITVTEASGEAVFVATLSAPNAVPVVATYRTMDGTAQAGLDYETAAGTLIFAPGVVQERILVRLIRDGRDWRAETFSVAFLSVSNARLEDAVAEATIVEEDPVEEGVLAAYLARFARTAASHVVEAIGERLRWQELEPSCRSVPADAMGMMRYANPNWDPSAGELLSGCGLVATSGALGVWGRGAFTRQSGKEGALSLNADVATGAMGVDYSWKGRLMAGLLFSHSQASGTFEAYSAEGETRSGLTGAYPYVSYRLRSGTLWAAAGLGRGQSEVTGLEQVEADLGSSLWAVGAVGTLASGQWAQLLYQADAFVTRAEAEGRAEVMVSRVRAGLEGSMVLASPLQPYLEVALRHDGGDAETGLGLELGSGVRLARPGSRLRAELRSRGLVMHADGTLSEWGVAGALRYGAQRGLGPSAEVRPVWGPARAGGMHALWRHDTVADAAGGLPGRRRVEVKFGYGMRLKKERNVARPVLAVVWRGTGRDYRLGYEVQLDNGLAFSASAAAYETDPWRPVRYGLTTGAALRW